MNYEFNHIHMISTDPDASERFYREMFGAETVSRRELLGSTTVAMKLGTVRLLIRGARPGETVEGDGRPLRFTYDHFGFTVDNVDEAVNELRGKGVAVYMEPTDWPSGSRIAYVEGPDHTRIELVQRS